MTESQTGRDDASRNLGEGIGIDQNPETILKTLQTIASHDEVASVAIRCVELLQHKDEEIRSWAAECLSASVRPSKDEQWPLLDALEAKLTEGNQGDSAGDELYWLVTLVGRLDLDDPATTDRAKALLTEVTASADSSAADRAERILRRV